MRPPTRRRATARRYWRSYAKADLSPWPGRTCPTGCGSNGKAVEADVKMAQVKQQMMSAEEVMALMGGILDSIRRHVLDQDTRAAIGRDIRALGSGSGVTPEETPPDEAEEPRGNWPPEEDV
jgi:hypothetical protein